MKCYEKDYPRPQFVRKEWENLNGTWGFAFDDNDCGKKDRWFEKFPAQRAIEVPYTYETEQSGIGENESHNIVWYARQFSVDASKKNCGRIILHIEGCDFLSDVWVNGCFAGSHRGGYARFSIDVTELVKEGENHLVIRAKDSFDREIPRGKQRWLPENFGCWYVQTTGIWKTVWMEYVPACSLTAVKMTTDLRQKRLELLYEVAGRPENFDGSLQVETTVSFEGKTVSRTTTTMTEPKVRTAVDMRLANDQRVEWDVMTWSPEHPYLYDLEFRLLRDGKVLDEVGSYTAMREIRIDGSTILLNGEPLYQRLILDQGYWKSTHLTPLNEEALMEDIDKIHALGYNGLRKHQKIEDERFLYWCDVKGMLVWSEMPSTYRFGDDAVAEFTREWMEIVRQNYNHPCIITWTPFNESWGVPEIKTDRRQQHFTEAIYHLTKSFDAMRPVIVNDGWEHTVSDIITLHDYEEAGAVLKERYTLYQKEILSAKVYHSRYRSAFAEGFSYDGKPVIISEFGGIAFNNDDAGWGYGKKVNGEEDFLRRFDEITTAIKEIPYVCGYCYTQVSDVQQEINGLMDEDRNYKINPEKIREINERPAGVLYAFGK